MSYTHLYIHTRVQMYWERIRHFSLQFHYLLEDIRDEDRGIVVIKRKISLSFGKFQCKFLKDFIGNLSQPCNTYSRNMWPSLEEKRRSNAISSYMSVSWWSPLYTVSYTKSAFYLYICTRNYLVLESISSTDVIPKFVRFSDEYLK